MTEKRRDNKGRLLRNGELQRSDGRYEYRYFDVQGVKRSVYSWKLVSTDKLPGGKRCQESLRDMEKRITKDIADDIRAFESDRTTLNFFFDDYIKTKYELKQSTRTNYKYMYNKYVRNEIGSQNISSIKYSDIKKFYIHLMRDIGFKPNSIENIHTILHPVFAIAVRDGLIRTNPTDGVMAEIKRSHDWEKPKRHALTIEQQEAFIRYCSETPKYRHWLTLFTVLLGTGCRVGEVVGLRWQDCDFIQKIIHINHSLIYRLQDDGHVEFHVTTPKTKAGARVIPMLDDVKRALTDEHDRQMVCGFNETTVDGYHGFIFMNRYGTVLSPHNINRAIKRIYTEYNTKESERAQVEQREPILIPHFSVHNLRHTFCTRFCENETNIKIIQEIMGHADITTTMDVYNEATQAKKIESFANLEGKIKIS